MSRGASSGSPVVGNPVRYSKDGVVFYTRTSAPTYPLLMDTYLGSVGSTISNAMISGNLARP